jgi:DNA-binding beta-propeller fold protein YncE
LETLKMSTRYALTAALLFALACGKAGAPSITTQPAAATAAAGDTATFTAAASGSSLTYQWLRNGTPINGATSASYTTPALTAADDNAAYAVQVKSDGGTVVSNVATLRVNWIRIDGQPQDDGITLGGPAALAVAASASGTLAYQWTKNGAPITGGTAATYKVATVLAVDAGSYTCVVTSTLGSTTATAQSNAAVLSVIGLPTISSQPQSITVAAGTPATFVVTASDKDAIGYQWQKSGAAWTNIAGATLPTLTIASPSAADAGAYRVVVTASHGQFAAQTISADAILTVATPATVVGAGDKIVAERKSLSLTAAATAAAGMSLPAYQWRKNGVDIADATAATFTIATVRPADAGVYVVVVSSAINGFAVTSTASSNVSVVPAPLITSQPTGDEVNEHGTFTVSVVATAIDSIGYQWTLDGVPIAGATSPSYSVTDAGATAAGGYACVVSNTRQGVTATTTSATATEIVHAPPQIITQPADQNVLESETATFTVAAAGSGLTYQWYRNASPIPGATSTSYTTSPVDLVADQGASFSCTISNGLPPDETTRTAVLTVSPYPTRFNSSVASLVKGEGAILTWRFVGSATFQDGSNTPVTVQTGTSQVVYPTTDTAYTLTVTNHGNTEVKTLTIPVKTYAPTNLYVLVQYPHSSVQTANPPRDAIARYKVNFFPGNPTFSVPPYYAPDNISGGAAANESKPTGVFPIHVAVSPDESRLYVANNGDATISAFSIDATTGVLTEITGSPFKIANDARPFAGAVDPSGGHYYVACQDGVRVFSIDATTGALTAQPSLDVTITGRVEGDLLIHPSGQYVYVADHGHDKVQVYTLDTSTGALALASTVASSGGPTGMAFDRAGARLFTRGADATPIPDPNPNGLTDNAAIHVFAVDPFTGALAETSTYRGYGPNAWAQYGVGPMPFVPGKDAHLHGLAYSRRAGIDILYDAYQGDLSAGVGEGFSMSALDVTGGTIAGDHVVTGTLGMSPLQLDVFRFGSQGGGVFTDRSGSALVLTGWADLPYGLNAAAYYPTDPNTGKLLPPPQNGFNAEGSLSIGDINYISNPTHGAFIGVRQ